MGCFHIHRQPKHPKAHNQAFRLPLRLWHDGLLVIENRRKRQMEISLFLVLMGMAVWLWVSAFVMWAWERIMTLCLDLL